VWAGGVKKEKKRLRPRGDLGPKKLIVKHKSGGGIKLIRLTRAVVIEGARCIISGAQRGRGEKVFRRRKGLGWTGVGAEEGGGH